MSALKPPAVLDNNAIKEKLASIKKHESKIVKRHNKAVEAWEKGKTINNGTRDEEEEDSGDDADADGMAVGLSQGSQGSQENSGSILRSYFGSKRWRGGIATTDTSLRGLYTSLCKDLVVEGGSSYEGNTITPEIDWAKHKKGVSAYRQVKYAKDQIPAFLSHGVMLHSDDIPLVQVNAAIELKKSRNDKKTLTGILNSIEVRTDGDSDSSMTYKRLKHCACFALHRTSATRSTPT